jgi:DNA repair exonuclease SbcCD ATPase subunit
MKIHNVKITNFKSCYDTQEFNFDDLQGLVKLSGPIGSGKTLLCEALLWGLLGTVKGQTNPSLISWNTDFCEIEINLTSKNKEIYIKRNIREALYIEVNGKQLIASSKKNMQTILEEDLYDVPKLAIVKMCLISFNGFSSIADMNPGQTKEFIDEIFGFKLFTEYNSIVQEEKRSIQNNTIKLIALQEDSNKNIESLKQKKYEQQLQLESNIDVKKLNEKRNKLIEEGKSIKSVYDSIYNEFKEKEKSLNDQKLQYYTKKNEYLTLGKQERKFIDTFKNGKCPTCNHDVDPVLIEEHNIKCTEYRAKYALEEANENNVSNQITELNKEYNSKLYKEQEKINNIKAEIRKIDSDISIFNNKLKISNENYDDLINTYIEKLTKIKEDIEVSNKEMEEWIQMEELLTKTLRYQLLDVLIPHINKSISYFINRLEQPYRIEFDKEFKAHIYSESFEKEIAYNNLSTGQKKTVDIAIIFGILQNIITNVDLNILVMDELMSNMDSDSRNIMLSVLKDSMGEDKSIFIVNHAEMNDDYFDHKIRVSQVNKKIMVQKKKEEPKPIIVKASKYEKIF